MPSSDRLETARLQLRPRRADDLESCLDLDMNPEVGRYLYPHGRPTPQERRAALEKQLDGTWPPVGGIWVVERRDAPGFLGWCGLFPLQDSGLVEIGYRYLPVAWGQGIATEAATRVLDYGFRVLCLDPIVAVTHPDNRGSQAVLRKIGLQHLGLRYYYGLDLEYFELSRERYLATATSG